MDTTARLGVMEYFSNLLGLDRGAQADSGAGAEGPCRALYIYERFATRMAKTPRDGTHARVRTRATGPVGPPWRCWALP